MHNSQIVKKIRGGGSLAASLFCAAATICVSAATAANLSDVQIVDGTLTVDTAGEWIVDRDVSCTTLAITADSPVTFVNPSESQTNTVTVGTITSVANANPVFNCKVQFSSTYNVTAESPIAFAGGAKATVPGTVGGTYGTTLTGDIEFTSNWTLGQTGWVVPSGSRFKGRDLTTPYAKGYTFTVQVGAYAHVASVYSGTDAVILSVNGELDVDGLLKGGSYPSDKYRGYIGTAGNVGLVRAAGLQRAKQNNKNNYALTYTRIPTYYLGAQGISVVYGASSTDNEPLAFAATGGQTIHATADFTVSSTLAMVTAIRFDTPFTLDTDGHDVTWNAITGGSKVFTKTGAGTLSLCTTNRCSGGTVVDAGTLRVAHEKGLGTGAVTVESGATLEVADGVGATGSFVLKGGTTLKFGDEASLVGPVTLSLKEGEQVTIDAPSVSALLLSGTGLTSADLSKFKLADGVVGTLRLTDDGLLTLGTTYTWVGGTDGRFSTLANWQLPGGDAPKTVPGAGDTVVFAAAGGAVTNDLDDLSVSDISFSAEAGAFTIHGNAISNFAQVDNASANVQTFSNAVEFAAAYNVTAESPVVFAGGATATAPTAGTVGGTYGKTLSGDIEFTSNWSLPNDGWVLTSGSRLKGKDLTGTGTDYKFTVEAGAYAHFTSVYTGTDTMRLSLNGEMDVDGLLQGGSYPANRHRGFIGMTGDVGLVRAAGLQRSKQRNKNQWALTYAYIPTYYLGAQGISVMYGASSTDNEPLVFAATGGQTIHATADFTVSSTLAMVTAIRLDTPFTLDTDGHDVTWNAITGGSKGITKTGAGVLSLRTANTYTGGTVVNAGTVRAEHANGLGTGAVTVEAGATLAIADGVALASSVTLAAGATIDFGSGATVNLDYAIACDGAATVKVAGDFSAMSAGSSVTLGTLDENVDVNSLVFDGSGLTLPRGLLALLKRDGDNLVLRMEKPGFTLIVK